MDLNASIGLLKTQKALWLALPEVGRVQFTPSAKIDGAIVENLEWAVAKSTKSILTFEAHGDHGKWTLTATQGKDESLSLSLSCRLKKTPQRVELTPLNIKRLVADHLLCHGRSMGDCFSYLLSEEQKTSFLSTFFLSITKNGTTLQLSHPLLQGDLSDFMGEIKEGVVHALRATTVIEPCHGKTFQSAAVTLTSSKDGHSLIREWSRIQTEEREPLPVPQESGWNTWDYYRWTITEEEVFKNADLIASDKVLSKHIKRIIIDDGWQHCYGEWEANYFFPSGMKKVAQKLKRMGFTPGLWFAPTIMEPHARISQLNPEMLAQGRSLIPCLGYSCMERYGMILDPTVPAVKEWWHNLFSRYAEWGYRYFKLDFLASTLNAPVFADRQISKGQIMQEIITPIRNAVGKQSRILGCNYQFQGGFNGVDDVRVSADIHANWGAIKDNAMSIAARFWSHRTLWINDADFLLCRGEETASDPDLHRLKPILVFVKPEMTGLDPAFYNDSLVGMNAEEAKVLSSLVIASGGAMNLSDNLPRLNEVGLEIARKVVTAEKGNAAIPLDLFRSKLPSYWVQQLDSGTQRVLMINWTEKPAEYSVNLPALNLHARNARDFWSGESVPVKNGNLSVTLKPHSCLLAELK